MSGAHGSRSRVTIMTELKDVTDRMLHNRSSFDIMLRGVEERQGLMEEFDMLSADDLSEDDRRTIKSLAKEILQKDSILNAALETLRAESKQNLAENQAKQRVLGYTNNAMSASGSYMDYKK